MKKTHTFIIVLFISFIAAACTNDQHYQNFEKSDYNLSTREDRTDNLEQSPSYYTLNAAPEAHQNEWFELSQRTANELMKIHGLNLTFVAITDSNAYVAVSMDNTAFGSAGNGNNSSPKNPDMLGSQKNGLKPNQWQQDPGYPFNELYGHYLSPEHTNISSKLLERIGKKVRELNPQVERVFITSDRDFFNQMHRYYQTAAQGKPIEPYIQEFNDAVTRLFSVPSSNQ